MLRLTKKADYGLIAVKHLAERPGAASSAKDIADEYCIPQQALAKILQRLTREGLLVSAHGVNGGYVLARSPAAISLLEVIRAIEGPLFITTCFTAEVCDQSGRCTIKEPLRRVNESIATILQSVSVAQISEPDLARSDGSLINIEEAQPART